MGAVGASAPTVFGKFLTFASIFIEMIGKMLQSNFKHPQFEIANGGLVKLC